MTTEARTQAPQPSQRNGSNAQPATPKPKRDPDRLQRALLTSMKDVSVVVTLLDGSELSGTLRAADRYSLAVQEDGKNHVCAVYKHAVACVRPAQEAPDAAAAPDGK